MNKILLLTSQFFAFAGSEMVVFEAAKYFISKGYQVDIAASVIGSPLSYIATLAGANVMHLDGKLNVSDYHIVWTQHGTLGNIDWKPLAKSTKRPFIISAHLSPFAELEKSIHPLENRLSDLIVFNSKETQEIFTKKFPINKQFILNNCCPSEFFCNRSYSPKLESLTVISNHIAGEIHHVLMHMGRNLGININIIGYGYTQKAIEVNDIIQSDAIITIGKSVQCALASRTPVYVYDIHGGSGWVKPDNIDHFGWYNFSGRPERRVLSSEDIFKEITDGYLDAIESVKSIDQEKIDIYKNSTYFDYIINCANSDRPALNLNSKDIIFCDTFYHALRNIQISMNKRYWGMCNEIMHKPSSQTYYC